jgi:ribosomal-protein-alanine N-acetyltransferase
MIRAATDDDVAAVARLEEVCLGDDAWSPGLVAEGIGKRLPTVSYLVGTSDDGSEEVVGYAVASLAGDDVELQRIAVAPAYRRRGLASALLAEVESVALAAGGARLLLEVRDDNATAIAFYESRGFAELGRRRGYYRDGAAAVVLGKKIGHRDGTASVTTPDGYGR